ncbi:hypothetical protein DSCA_24160 [Desulfosarcina alkanivorans]|uniref:Uncharacterized protein n=1 Tax=Desulfosarcina alkanivorans TaxID=571177 RepID=A0A5K7YH94_9BACT|nr:hypothetical protein DSCA_24160 [Desulfosarcina alkanivorans]
MPNKIDFIHPGTLFTFWSYRFALRNARQRGIDKEGSNRFETGPTLLDPITDNYPRRIRIVKKNEY